MSRLTLIEPCFVTTLRKKKLKNYRPQTAEHIQIFLDLIRIVLWGCIQSYKWYQKSLMYQNVVEG